MTLFLAQPEEYRYLSSEINSTYQSDPEGFARTFFDLLPQINPKVVRLIGYQLYTKGVDFGQLYKLRDIEEKPRFLFDLASFPLESMIVLLKYQFPQVIDGDLFFLTSLDQIRMGSPFSNLDWLDFYLDLCQHLGVNINHINRSTGGTILHYFIEAGWLPGVELLLCHRAVPTLIDRKGRTPLRLAIDSIDPARYRVYLQIIRQLSRYGARPREEDRRAIESSPYQIKINQEIQIGASLNPDHCKSYRDYFALDQVEDLGLIVEVEPEIIQDEKFRQLVPGTNFEALTKSVEQIQDETIQVDKVIVSWPYYINTSKKIFCQVEEEEEATAASPPSSRKVYELALRGLPDNQGVPNEKMRPPPVPPIPRPETWFSATYYVPSDSGTTFPLPTPAINPTANPPLPSL